MKTNYTFTAIAGLCLSVANLIAQTPTGSIADWKDDAQAAYTLVHDDYGDTGVDGIWQYADTIASSRGIKFTFGAIASACETSRNINGYSSPYDFAKNVMIAQHGHEIMNHSHTHDCAVGNAGWSPCDMSIGWGEDTNDPNFTTQLNTAHTSITTNSGFEPKYYIFPYDRFTNAANDRLKQLNYLGSRTGWTSHVGENYPTNGYENNDSKSFYPDNDGFFRTSVQVFGDVEAKYDVAGQVALLKSELDATIAAGEWHNQELHNVGDLGWGSVKVGAYRQHLNYLKTLIDAGTLWVPTISEMLTYQLQKFKFSPDVSYNGSDEITVDWTSINPAININAGTILDGLTVKTELTLIVDLDGLPGSWIVTQNSVPVNGVVAKNGKLYINVYPHEGSVLIKKDNGNQNNAPYVENALADQNLQENFSAYQIDLLNMFGDAETADGDLIMTVTGNSNIQINIVNGVATISVASNWTGNETVTFTTEDEGGLKANEVVVFNVAGLGNQTPFISAIQIPGMVEAENFDNGVDGEAFHEVATNWEPDPAINPYRANHDVDIEAISGGYAIAFSENGEWLEYTVEVAKTGNYDFTFRTAQEQDQWSSKGEFKVLLDNNTVINSLENVYTNSWTTYTDLVYNDAFLTAGTHILRIEFTKGSINFDYLNTALTNEAPYVENSLSNYDLDQDFTGFNIDLNNVFEDSETSDVNLTYSVSGNSNILVTINNGVASIGVTQGWTGIEVLTFKVVDEGGLEKTHIVSFEVDVPTGIKVKELDEEVFSIYPNPTNGKLFVYGDVNTIQVFGAQGNLLIQSGSNQLDLIDYPAGIYFVRINNNGKLYRVVKTK